jgi:hypothetical protein
MDISGDRDDVLQPAAIPLDDAVELKIEVRVRVEDIIPLREGDFRNFS